MEFKKNKLEEAFQDYYLKHGNVATHIFVYSGHQHETIRHFGTTDFKMPQSYVNGLPYSEMRSRDSENLVFIHEDTFFVAVGTNKDISHTLK
jgi:hypothetical protein